jgi:rSAM/selenodomain-associated transferase 1
VNTAREGSGARAGAGRSLAASPLVCIFCRAPVPGRTKTRLAAAIGDERAAALSSAMLLDIATTLTADGLDVRAAAADPIDVGTLRALLPGIDVHSQPEGDLGTRMSAVLEQLMSASGRTAAIVGADAVLIRPELVRRAGEAIVGGADAAICPASDGGYSLIAAARPVPALFRAISWGSAHVLDQTLSRASDAGLRVALLEVLDDIDVVEDLARVTENSALSRSSVAVRTRHLCSALSVGARGS